ncbi:uncharacterized protein LOC141623139 [Silene latifolia]|uniref:uncharacterized protein LOC141623139 n=1 Tax=Silene latifolia TaxID=37657 RepID=UPI003D773279
MFPKLENEKLLDQHFIDEQEEEEALSFSDLPITKFIISNAGDDDEEEEEKNGTNEDEPEFDFGSLVDSGNGIKIEMCSADEVFSGGQILPFRHSVSSDTTRTANWRSASRSESIESCSRSSSIRSSSIRSQFSTSSSSTSTTSSNNTSFSIKTVPQAKIRVRNTFNSHPSPKPQVWAPGPRGSAPNPRKTTMWDVLRLGLVRTPEIELQDLKQRHRSSTSGKTPFIIPRNNSSGSNNSRNSESKTTDVSNKINDLFTELNKKKKNDNDGGFFKSCKCSVMAIEPIPTREYGVRHKISDGPKKGKPSMNYYRILKEDKEMEQKKVIVQEQEQKGKKQQIRHGKKKVMSHQHHHRTFEWLKDLSHATVLNS